MAQTSDYYGSIVAFEGTRDTVSTQLRLLPSSPKILVLPPLQHFIQEGDPDEPFDARTYVLKVHDACSARNKLALSFLQNSSPDDKKLAFMNGGTASAQAMCITAISQHMDEPCIPSAKNTFATLARGGVARLRNPSATPEGHCRHHSSATSHSSATQEEPDHVRRMSEAMRAADALDRETASLQPDNDMDLTNLSRSRSLSAPLRRLFDDLEGDTPFYLIGASQDRDEAIPVLGVSQKAPSNVHGLSVGKARGSRLSRANRSSDDIKWEHSTNQWSSGCAGELGLPPSPRSTSTFGSVLSPETTTFGSLPNAPIVTYGEARLIDVRWSPKRIPSRQPRRIRSVDRVYASTIETRNISGGDSNEPLASRFPYDLPSPTKLPLRSRFNEASAQATFVESNRGRTRQQPPTLLDLSNQIKSRRRHMYVDKGTGPAQSYLDDRHLGRHRRLDHGVDTNDLSTAKPTASPFDADAPFEVVLPLHEDLVIHLNDTKHNTLLGSIIQDFKRRVLPLTAAPVTEVLESHSDTLQGHMSRYEAQAQRETCSPPAAIATPDCSVDEEYDPPASHDACLQPQIPWSQQDGGRRRQPFTPARTPSPVMAVPEKSFHEFQTTGCSTVVGVQNSLRSVLNIYFSADEPGYQQYPLLPELSRMWKPVFRQTDGYGDKQHERELDLILAVGGQKGVSRDFISSLTGSLGNLGVRANGMTRSNRLDLR